MDSDFPFQIGEKPVIFDVGGYEGDFTDCMRKKYGCGVHIFEPVKAFFLKIMERFKGDALVWPYDVALENRDSYEYICIKNNSSSMYGTVDNSDVFEMIRVRDIFRFIEAFHFPKIDILKLNCEGSEYKILGRLIEVRWIVNVKNIAVQFHPVEGIDLAAFRKEIEVTHIVRHQDDHWTWYESKL